MPLFCIINLCQCVTDIIPHHYQELWITDREEPAMFCGLERFPTRIGSWPMLSLFATLSRKPNSLLTCKFILNMNIIFLLLDMWHCVCHLQKHFDEIFFPLQVSPAHSWLNIVISHSNKQIFISFLLVIQNLQFCFLTTHKQQSQYRWAASMLQVKIKFRLKPVNLQSATKLLRHCT